MTATAFDLDETVALLQRTPAVLEALLVALPEAWLRAADGPEGWSPYEVVGHLIHGEETDWLVRTRHILSGDPAPFAPFDRIAHLVTGDAPAVEALLARFAELRRANLAALAALHLGEADLERTGHHPELGEVTLGQLLATWAVHDLNHLAQIAQAMARRYDAATGPWRQYLGILGDAAIPSE